MADAQTGRKTLLLKIHPETPQRRHVQRVAQILREGGIAIIPTDAVYVLVGDLLVREAHERLTLLKKIEPARATFSILCADLSQASQYMAPLSKETFRVIRRHIPGPYTFILPASKHVPRVFLNRRQTIGIRVPDHPFPRMLAEELGNPLVSTSLYDEEGDYMVDPKEIFETWKGQVEVVVDGGPGGRVPSTVIDLTSSEPQVVRTGAGEILF